MDEVIYLEPDEEITSVIDKMKKSSAQELALVVPREATILQSVVNLRLLAKEAEVLSKRIAIVTADKIGRNLAAQVGLMVYASLNDQAPLNEPVRAKPAPASAEVIDLDDEQKENSMVKVHHFQENGETTERQEPAYFPPQEPEIIEAPPTNQTRPAKAKLSSDHNSAIKKVFLLITIIILVLLGIGAYLLVPKAEVSVSVLAEDFQKSLPITLAGAVTKADETNGIFPAELVSSEKSAKEKFAATGKKNLGVKASGSVTFYNNLDSNPHILNPGAKLSSSSKTFLIKEKTVIPPATVQNLRIVPGTVTVTVEAENPGTEYNVKAGRFTILGLASAQQEALYGQSSKDFTGGLSKEVQVVSREDYDNAKKKLVDGLSQTILEELKSKVKDGKVLDKAINLDEPLVTSSAKVDEEATDFEMEIKMRSEAMVFDYSSFKEFLVKILASQAPADKMVAIPDEESIVLTVDKLAYDKKELNLTANVDAKIGPKISEAKIASSVLGRSLGEVESTIKKQDGVKAVKVSFQPSWWPKRLPNLERNVKVKINYVTE